MVEKNIAAEAKTNFHHFLRLKRLILGVQGAISRWSIKTRIIPIRSIKMKLQKIRLSPTTLFLLINLISKSPRKTSKEANKETIQLLGSMPPR